MTNYYHDTMHATPVTFCRGRISKMASVRLERRTDGWMDSGREGGRDGRMGGRMDGWLGCTHRGDEMPLRLDHQTPGESVHGSTRLGAWSLARLAPSAVSWKAALGFDYVGTTPPTLFARLAGRVAITTLACEERTVTFRPNQIQGDT